MHLEVSITEPFQVYIDILLQLALLPLQHLLHEALIQRKEELSKSIFPLMPYGGVHVVEQDLQLVFIDQDFVIAPVQRLLEVSIRQLLLRA